jgi:hypothetical protein
MSGTANSVIDPEAVALASCYALLLCKAAERRAKEREAIIVGIGVGTDENVIDSTTVDSTPVVQNTQ